jgi:DNA-binding response OmpR family regulator
VLREDGRSGLPALHELHPELVARVHALTRRAKGNGADAEVFDNERSGIPMDARSRTVTVDGDVVSVTPPGWRLLLALMRHRGQVLSADQLLELAWNDPVGVSSERVKFAVLRLRRKLGRAGSCIANLRGFGYRM